MKRLIAFISILMLLVSMAYGTATSITIYGTNKSNAQDNVTCYGCNNTISVQAWNTSYVKNITIESKNGTGGDVVSFNISNVTAFQVQELKVNKTAVNAYQAGANGMLNFSYTVVGNKTLVLSPAQNINGYNMTWAKVWNGLPYTKQDLVYPACSTVYQNTNNSAIHIVTNITGSSNGIIRALVGSTNPPATGAGDINIGYISPLIFVVLPNHYWQVVPVSPATCAITSSVVTR